MLNYKASKELGLVQRLNKVEFQFGKEKPVQGFTCLFGKSETTLHNTAQERCSVFNTFCL